MKKYKNQFRKTDKTEKYLRSTASYSVRFYVYIHAHVYVSNLRKLPIVSAPNGSAATWACACTKPLFLRPVSHRVVLFGTVTHETPSTRNGFNVQQVQCAEFNSLDKTNLFFPKQ